MLSSVYTTRICRRSRYGRQTWAVDPEELPAQSQGHCARELGAVGCFKTQPRSGSFA